MEVVPTAIYESDTDRKRTGIQGATASVLILLRFLGKAPTLPPMILVQKAKDEFERCGRWKLKHHTLSLGHPYTDMTGKILTKQRRCIDTHGSIEQKRYMRG